MRALAMDVDPDCPRGCGCGGQGDTARSCWAHVPCLRWGERHGIVHSNPLVVPHTPMSASTLSSVHVIESCSMAREHGSRDQQGAASQSAVTKRAHAVVFGALAMQVSSVLLMDGRLHLGFPAYPEVGLVPSCPITPPSRPTTDAQIAASAVAKPSPPSSSSMLPPRSTGGSS